MKCIVLKFLFTILNMRSLFTLVSGLFFFAQQSISQPAANAKAIVPAGSDVRFTVLTSGLIRMEWNRAGNFTDNASFVVVNRKLPVPAYKVSSEQGWTVITTGKCQLRYKKGSGSFTGANLVIRSVGDTKVPFEWKPGMKQHRNLKGTYRTLDTYDGDMHKSGRKMPIEDGLLARDGWTFLDDSKSFLFDNAPWPWVEERKDKDGRDWYFMAYGSDYKSALKDFTLISGKVPLPPRYAFGYWWSRYWSYSDSELRSVVDEFEKYNIPVDVLVMDMDWHRTDSIGRQPDEFGQPKWWTGWTWNRSLFPDPEKFLKWTDSKNLKTTINLHPASGVASFEEQYSAFAKRMNFNTSTKRNIPYVGSDKKFMTALFDVILRPMEKWGVDFWWLDWQQWLYDKKIDSLSNTWWLNYVFFTEMERNRNTRPMLYHRWGGLGNHRYQIGFSGDSYITWKSLAFQPYFTSTASNVLYGYWSHDIGGHMFKNVNNRTLDPELYTRWLQYGTFSPILRTHSTKDAALNKEIWKFKGDYFDAQRDAINLRYSLVPYIYTAARDCYDSGISLCHPLYYDYPLAEESYKYRNHYFFGDDILIASVVTPSNDGVSSVNVWLPEGNDWFEWHTGPLLKGGKQYKRDFTITEYPIYIKAGSMLPLYGKVKNLDEQPEQVRLAIFPGGVHGKGKMYEDNGNDKDYAKQYALTTYSTDVRGNKTTIKIASRKGSYKNMPVKRQYTLELYGVPAPVAVSVNGKQQAYSYRGDQLCLVVDLPLTDPARAQQVDILYPKENQEINDGLISRFSKLKKATTELKFLFSAAGMRGQLPDVINSTSETPVKLGYDPGRFNELIKAFRKEYQQIPEALNSMEKISAEDKSWYLKAIGIK